MITSRRYEEHRLLVHTVVGPVTLAQLRSAVEDSHVGTVMPLEIWDFSEARPENIDMEGLGNLLGELFRFDNAEEEEKTAFIVPGEEARELTLLFQRMAEFQEYPVAFRSFPDLPSAIHWLFGSNWTGPLRTLSPETAGEDTDRA